MDPDTTTPQPEEGQIVEAPVVQDANMVLNLEETIKTHLASIERLNDELSKSKSLLDSIFENDATFTQHDKQAKEAIKIRTGTKQQILKQPQAAELSEKVRDIRIEIKENEEALSDYLREFQRISGLNEIEDNQGELRQIIYVARLIKKTSNFEQ